MWWIIFFASIVLNVFCVWYIRELLKRFKYHSEISSNLLTVVVNYEEHLNTIYGMEAYYGDGTLEGLLRHTKDMRGEIEEYSQIFTLFEGKELNEPQEE